MQAVEPIIVVDLFPQERRLLLELFAGLTEEDWQRPTVCAGWTVRDIGLHLLGDDIGYLSGKRDQFKNPFFAGRDMKRWESLVQNINEANELWVRAMQRVSPVLLCALLELTGKQFYEYLSSLDAMAMGGPVNWAGPQDAPEWLDIAREYTERWLHQQQIRDAVNRPGMKERQFFHPVLDTFVRALPHTYRDVAVTETTVVKLVVTGEAGGVWYVVGEANGWSLYKAVELQPTSVVTMDQEMCWRLFTKGIDKEQARVSVRIEGDEALGEKVLETVSIIA
ncbi:MAG TPA: maleylpyruvate isomerase family mycothiol-dependent enzyme [Ktedonobacteraceae bacterium]